MSPMDESQVADLLIVSIVVLVVAHGALPWFTIETAHLSVLAGLVGTILTANHLSGDGGGDQ